MACFDLVLGDLDLLLGGDVEYPQRFGVVMLDEAVVSDAVDRQDRRDGEAGFYLAAGPEERFDDLRERPLASDC